MQRNLFLLFTRINHLIFSFGFEGDFQEKDGLGYALKDKRGVYQPGRG
jgi:hypothetical protein